MCVNVLLKDLHTYDCLLNISYHCKVGVIYMLNKNCVMTACSLYHYANSCQSVCNFLLKHELMYIQDILYVVTASTWCQCIVHVPVGNAHVKDVRCAFKTFVVTACNLYQCQVVPVGNFYVDETYCVRCILP